jgi:hypothetical protein
MVWRRLTTAARSCVSLVRWRVRSRSSRWSRANEARSQQPRLQELRDPLAIFHVCLAPRHLLDVAGVDQQHLELPFEQVVDRFPVASRRLHRDVGHCLLCQPIHQRQDVSRHRAEGTDLFPHGAVCQQATHTRRDELLVDIQSTHTLIQRFHDLSLSERARGTSGGFVTLLRVLPNRTGRQSRVPKGRPGQTNPRALGTRAKSTFFSGALAQLLLRRNAIFIDLRVSPQAT